MDASSKKPSSLIRRDDLPTLRSQGVINLPFNTERDNFSELNKVSIEAHRKIQSYIQIPPGGETLKIAPPLHKREELQVAKEALKTFQDMKSQKIFIKKRNRII